MANEYSQLDHPKSQPYGEDVLACFSIVSRLLGNFVSAQALKADIPLTDLGFTPGLCSASLERFNFETSYLDVPYKQLKLFTPCIVFLDDNKACVLLEIHETYAKVFLPTNSDQPLDISLEKLKKFYAGQATLIKYIPSQTLEAGPTKPMRHLRDITWFWDELKPFYSQFTKIIISSIAINLLVLGSVLYAMEVYDKVVSTANMSTLFVLSVIVILVYTGEYTLRTLRGGWIDIIGRNIEVLLGETLYKRILGLKLSSRPPSSGGLAHYLKEFDGVKEFFSSASANIIDVVFVIFFLWGVAVISPTMLVVPLIGITFTALLNGLTHYLFKGSIKKSLNHMEYKHAFLLESLGALETIKALCAENQILGKWRHSVDAAAKASYKIHSRSMKLSNLSYLIQNFSYVALIILGVYEIVEKQLTIGGLIAITILTTRSMGAFSNVVSTLVRGHQAITSLKMLDSIIILPSERSPYIKLIPRPHIKGDIEFFNVNFTYPNQDQPILENISFKIAAGEKVAILGEIGSGKSTLAKLLLGLYQPTSGSVLLDNIDVKHSDFSDIRINIGYLSQDIELFRGTLRDNITISNPIIGDQQLSFVCKLSGVEEFARLNPLGYDMPIGERGLGLSGGQRQSVGIARALIHNPPILLFDEPSASMDPMSEAKFIQRLESYTASKTLVLITHRKKVLSLVDRIIVLEKGRVRADGPPEAVFPFCFTELE